MDEDPLIKKRDILRAQANRYCRLAENILNRDVKELKELNAAQKRLKELLLAINNLDDKIVVLLDNEDLKEEFQLVFDYEDKLQCSLIDLEFVVKRINNEKKGRNSQSVYSRRNNISNYARNMAPPRLMTCTFCKESYFGYCPFYCDRKDKLEQMRCKRNKEKIQNEVEDSHDNVNKIQGNTIQDMVHKEDSTAVHKDNLPLVLVETIEKNVEKELENVSEEEILKCTVSIGEAESVKSTEMQKNDDDKKKHLVNRKLLEVNKVLLNSPCVQVKWDLTRNTEHSISLGGFHRRIKNIFCWTVLNSRGIEIKNVIFPRIIKVMDLRTLDIEPILNLTIYDAALKYETYLDRKAIKLEKPKLKEKTNRKLDDSNTIQYHLKQDITTQITDLTEISRDAIGSRLVLKNYIEFKDAYISKEKSAIYVLECSRTPGEASFFSVQINSNIIKEYFYCSEGFFGILRSNYLNYRFIKTEAISDLRIVGIEISITSIAENIETEAVTSLKMVEVILEVRRGHYDYDAGIC